MKHFLHDCEHSRYQKKISFFGGVIHTRTGAVLSKTKVNISTEQQKSLKKTWNKCTSNCQLSFLLIAHNISLIASKLWPCHNQNCTWLTRDSRHVKSILSMTKKRVIRRTREEKTTFTSSYKSCICVVVVGERLISHSCKLLRFLLDFYFLLPFGSISSLMLHVLINLGDFSLIQAEINNNYRPHSQFVPKRFLNSMISTSKEKLSLYPDYK